VVEQEPNNQVPVNPDQVMGPGEQAVDAPKEDETSDFISQPAKVMRIGSMVKSLLDEARSAPLDEAGRARLAEIYQISITELSGALSPDLGGELWRGRAQRVRTSYCPGATRGLAGGTLSRHPGLALRPAGRRRGATREDA
jgi:hypothetical protein